MFRFTILVLPTLDFSSRLHSVVAFFPVPLHTRPWVHIDIGTGFKDEQLDVHPADPKKTRRLAP